MLERKSIARVIRERRHTAGLSQEVLSERAEIHRTYLSMLERGLKSPTLEVFSRIALALGITPSTLLAEAENTYASKIPSKRGR